jgi:hypothetical protein
MIYITSDGEAGEIPIGGSLIGKELAVVILTRDDDKPELMDVFATNIFVRFPGADPSVFFPQVEDFQQKHLPHCTLLSVRLGEPHKTEAIHRCQLFQSTRRHGGCILSQLLAGCELLESRDQRN